MLCNVLKDRGVCGCDVVFHESGSPRWDDMRDKVCGSLMPGGPQQVGRFAKIC